MSPSRWLRWSAFFAVIVAALAVASPAGAIDFYEETRASLDLAPDPIARSPRLLGMGRLTLVIPDANNRLTLWDTGQLAAGLLDNDSISVIEFRPTTTAAASLRDVFAFGSRQERQSLAARDVLVSFEGWRRSDDDATFGMLGDFAILRRDLPFDDFSERRSSFFRPSIMPVINGAMPLIFQDRMRYALRAFYSFEDDQDEYRSFVVNEFGQYLDQNGDLLPAPDLFEPTRAEVSTFGGGGSVRYIFGAALTASAGYDLLSSDMKGENIGVRHGSFIEETRNVHVGQAALRGAVGQNFEWIVDGRGWRSSSEPEWRFTISAGQGGTPLTGRGLLLLRDEEGSTLRSRARLVAGSIEFGAALNTGYRKVDIVPPAVTDQSSFNFFRNLTWERVNSDSIALPDSISANVSELRSWEASGGASWRTPWRNSLLGVEYHFGQSQLDQTSAGAGPKRIAWDVRTGIEVPLNSVVTGRAGYIYRWDDRNDFTEQNEFISSAVTIGLGIRPAGTTWHIESGYMFEWSAADFGDPAEPRGNRNQFAAQVRWEL